MDSLFEIIHEILNEDLSGFIKKTVDLDYFGNLFDPTFETSPSRKLQAKDVKRSFASESDQEFFKNIRKIHWVSSATMYTPGKPLMSIKWLLTASGKDEISTTGYLQKQKKVGSVWGDFGIEVQGYITLAANSMDDIFSGYSDDIAPETSQKYKSSGVPKRPTLFTPYRRLNYSLDNSSFKNQIRNEIIVDNWRPVSVWVSEKVLNVLITLSNNTNVFDEDRRFVQNVVKVFDYLADQNLPIISCVTKKPLTKDSIRSLTDRAKNFMSTLKEGRFSFRDKANNDYTNVDIRYLHKQEHSIMKITTNRSIQL